MNINEVARIAALIGEPARTAMLLALMDTRSLTANELAIAANVMPQTASKHLAMLLAGGLLVVNQAGRHRYHRLASSQTAEVIEGIMQLAAQARPSVGRIFTGPKDADLRLARSCYDHIAGRLGVALSDHLLECGALKFDGETGTVSEHAVAALASLQFQFNREGKARDSRACLDWSERRVHVAGRLGAQLLTHFLAKNWLRRCAQARSLEITASGRRTMLNWLGAERWQTVLDA